MTRVEMIRVATEAFRKRIKDGGTENQAIQEAIKVCEAAKPKPDDAMVERVANAIHEAWHCKGTTLMDVAQTAIAAINDYMGEGKDSGSVLPNSDAFSPSPANYGDAATGNGAGCSGTTVRESGQSSLNSPARSTSASAATTSPATQQSGAQWRESVAIEALKKIDDMIGNAIGASTLRSPVMYESDSRFFSIFDVTKEALSKIEGGQS